MTPTPPPSEFHFLAALSDWLATKDARIAAYHYDGLSFGMWSILVVRYTERLSFVYNAREGSLQIESGRTFELRLSCEFKPEQTLSARNSAQARRSVEEFLRRRFNP